MMELTQSEEFVDLQSVVRAIAAQHITAAPTKPDRSATLPVKALKALNDMGLLTPTATEDGGQGIPSHLQWSVIAEELGKADAGTALDVVVGAYAAIVVGRCGTPEQRRLLAPTTASPPLRGTLLYFEGFGRTPAELESTAVPVGERVLVSGRKVVVVRATDSTFGVVVARQGDELAAVLMPAEAMSALRVVRDDACLGKIGVRSAATSIVDLGGAEGEALDHCSGLDLPQVIAGFRLAVASILLGVGEAAVRYAADYASSREAFGHPIADFQGVSFPLVESEIALDSARLAVRDLAAEADFFDDPGMLADRTSSVIAGATQAATVATVTAVNTLGGHGYLADHPVERWYRDAAVLAAVDFDPTLIDWSPTR